MKLSIEDRHGTDYAKAVFVTRAVIVLDGKRVERCTEANEEEGYVIRYAADEKGNLIVEGDDIKTERLCGKVQIIDPKGEFGPMCYYATDGTLMNANGTRSIFDDVDK